MLLSFLFLILATLCRMTAHEYVLDQQGNRSIEFNLLEKLLTGFETQLLGLENRLEKRIVGLETRLKNDMVGLQTRLDSIETSMMTKRDMQQYLLNRHDFDRNKVRGLEKISGYSPICGSFITTHYVVYKKKMFGISVAHTPCFLGDEIPEFVMAVPNLDVSIWRGVPPPEVSLLNITDSIVSAEIGDTATAFGLTMDAWPRAWQGMLVGRLNAEEKGRHFTNHAQHHKDELLFQGAQTGGMSGGAVLNGNG
jgi:hypothetical protein